jgi:histidinol phosphatase-like PHP family hydrolase
MVTFDSDTHLPNSFKNINNAIHIARDFNIPPELCLNTKNLAELRDIFKK